MDKFIQRQPSWKTKTYESFVATAAKKTQQVRAQVAAPNANRRPLGEHPVSNLKKTQHSSTVYGSETCEDRFVDVRSSSDSLSVFPCQAATQLHSQKENTVAAAEHLSTPTTTKSCPVATDSSTGTPKQQQHDPHFIRLQRDLNSPNAALRVRAIRALKSPTKAAVYHTFDVPLAEQSIITAAERDPKPLPSLRDILEKVVVFVEVRTGNDNRSEGVKTIIAKMGAQVNDRLLRNTTHVVFKDGLLSTYKKACEWNIPIVSILWIEACKVQRRLCEPELFPISNLNKYEYPELFGKITRVRCMQPDSELNKRPRKRQGTPTSKDKEPVGTPTSTPKNDIRRFLQNKHLGGSQDDEAAESPATNLLIRMSNGCFTPSHQQPADGKFKTNGSGDAIANVKDGKVPSQRSLAFSEEEAHGDELVASKRPRRSTVEPNPVSTPPSTSLNRRRSCSTAGELGTSKLAVTAPSSEPRMTRRRSCLQLAAANSPMELSNKRSCQSIHEESEEAPSKSIRRHSSLHLSASASKELKAKTSYHSIAEEPQPMAARRRSSLHVAASGPLETVINKDSPLTVGRRRSSWHQTASTSKEASKKPLFQPIAEEAQSEATCTEPLNISHATTPVSTQERRQTIYTPQQMDISRMHISTRTVTTSSTELKDSDQMELTILQQQSRLSVTTQTSQFDDEEPLFSSTRLPGNIGSRSSSGNNRRRTIFSLDIDKINEGIDRINRSSHRRSLALANEAELGQCHHLQSPLPMKKQKTEKPLQAVEVTATPLEPKRRRLFTPNEEVIISPPKSNRKSRQSISSRQSYTSKPTGSAVKRRRTLAGTSKKSSSPNVSLEAEKALTTDPSVTDTAPAVPATAAQAEPSSQEMLPAVVEPLPNEEASAEVAEIAADEVGSTEVATSLVTDNQAEVFVTPKGSLIETSINNNITDSPGVATTPSTTTDGKISTAKRRQRLIRTLVHTNMHQEQIHVIHKAIRKLHGMRLDPTVTKRTTHLVSLDPRRTLNLLRGLMRGVWIVSYGWVLESMRSGKWVNEERYEMKSFSRAVEICRTERQAFGKDYRCELFRFMESFYVSSHCQPLQFNNVKELLILGGAKITENRFKAKYIIGDKRRVEDDRVYLSVNWVLDTVTAMQVQKFGKYLMKSAIVTPAGIRYDNPPPYESTPPTSSRKLHTCYRDPPLVCDK